MKILTVIGTRPEAIKLSPVVRALRTIPSVSLLVCVTGQHKELLRPVLSFFRIDPDIDLRVMRENQSLENLSARILTRVGDVIEDYEPDRVVVQGDTTSAFVSALAAAYHKVPLGHVEAGLRTNRFTNPFPEELNRRLIAPLADLHFAPTALARDNLLREGIEPSSVHITGNTGIDAAKYVCERQKGGDVRRDSRIARLARISKLRRIVLVTCHRRENQGRQVENICRAIVALARRGDVEMVYVRHRNPGFKCVDKLLDDEDNITLLNPLPYPAFVDLLQRSHFVVTDSGGVQEECACFGKPVLVLREDTERKEGLREAGTQLVGATIERIVKMANLLLDSDERYDFMIPRQDCYGDGEATGRIVRALLEPPNKSMIR